MLLALGADELGSRLGPTLGAPTFHWTYLFLGLDEWACAPIFKYIYKESHLRFLFLILFFLLKKIIISDNYF